MEFRALATNNGFNGFIALFSKCDVEVRRLNKMMPSRARAAGYHIAANVTTLDERINKKVDHDMANPVAVLEAVMNGNALNSGATAHKTSVNETAANLVDQLTSNNQDTILAALKDIHERLDKVENGGNGRRRRDHGRGGNSGDGGGDFHPSVRIASLTSTATSATCNPTTSAGRWTPKRTTAPRTTPNLPLDLEAMTIDGKG